MSVINQMLRDLDARGNDSGEMPALERSVAGTPRRFGVKRAALSGALLLAGAVAGYFALSAGSSEHKPLAATHIAQYSPVFDPVEVAPAPSDEPSTVSNAPAEAPFVISAVVPEPVHQAMKSSVMSAGKMARSLTIPETVVQIASNVSDPTLKEPAVVKQEPAVVKKMAELSPEMEAQQLYDEALVLRRLGKVDAAMAKYRLALERQPGMRIARLQLARLLQDSGQADAAFSLLKVGYEHQSDGGLAIAAGRLLGDLGRRDEALIWLERGRESLRPADHALMGALLSQTLRYEESVKAYQRALAAEPNQGGWLLGLGLALEALGRGDEAQIAYRNALDRGEFKPDVVKFLRQKTGSIGQ